jgi:hypothetical protein
MAAGAAALLLAAGYSAAADQSTLNDETPARASEKQGAENRGAENHDSDPGAVKTVPDQAKQDEEYMAALKKCGSLKGSEKQQCTEAAQRKFSRM